MKTKIPFQWKIYCARRTGDHSGSNFEQANPNVVVINGHLSSFSGTARISTPAWFVLSQISIYPANIGFRGYPFEETEGETESEGEKERVRIEVTCLEENSYLRFRAEYFD